MQVLSLAAAFIALVRASECAAGSAMVQVRTGLGLMRDSEPLPDDSPQIAASTSVDAPPGTVARSSMPDTTRTAALAAASASAGVHAEAHRVLHDRLQEAIEAGQQAIDQDRKLLKLPSAEQQEPPKADGQTLNPQSAEAPKAPTINQMLELAANKSQINITPAAPAGLAPITSVPHNAPGTEANDHQQAPKPTSALPSSTEDLPELLSTENHMHMQASATTRRVADALQGAVSAEQEAQTLEAKAAELRANASLIRQRGAATAEQASAEIAKKTAQAAFMELSEIEQQAETAEVSAASYRAKAASAKQQADAAVTNMYHALNMTTTK